MRNYSTLIYFVNNKKDVKSTDLQMVESDWKGLSTRQKFEPSERSVKKILDFARSYDVLESEATGHIEMNLN